MLNYFHVCPGDDSGTGKNFEQRAGPSLRAFAKCVHLTSEMRVSDV